MPNGQFIFSRTLSTSKDHASRPRLVDQARAPVLTSPADHRDCATMGACDRTDYNRRFRVCLTCLMGLQKTRCENGLPLSQGDARTHFTDEATISNGSKHKRRQAQKAGTPIARIAAETPECYHAFFGQEYTPLIVDTLTPPQRSRLMSRVRGRNTRPEMLVRRLLHSLGYRYRLHRSDLPGRPDLTFPGRKVVIFVHGCFWHRHAKCKKATTPASNRDYWLAKFRQNKMRDRRKQRELEKLGWRVVVVWECETADLKSLGERLCSELEKD